METENTLSCHGRVDPWECYQDTWQTTCSVLEHHRDLMKVRWAVAERVWVGKEQERAAGLLTCWLASTFCFPPSCEVGQPASGAREDSELGPWSSTGFAPYLLFSDTSSLCRTG